MQSASAGRSTGHGGQTVAVAQQNFQAIGNGLGITDGDDETVLAVVNNVRCCAVGRRNYWHTTGHRFENYEPEPFEKGWEHQYIVTTDFLENLAMRERGDPADRKSTRLNSSHIPLSRMP